jgi:hypothetical protein
MAPVSDQFDENVPVERGEPERDEDKRYHARCASRHTTHIQFDAYIRFAAISQRSCPYKRQPWRGRQGL